MLSSLTSKLASQVWPLKVENRDHFQGYIFSQLWEQRLKKNSRSEFDIQCCLFFFIARFRNTCIFFSPFSWQTYVRNKEPVSHCVSSLDILWPKAEVDVTQKQSSSNWRLLSQSSTPAVCRDSQQNCCFPVFHHSALFVSAQHSYLTVHFCFLLWKFQSTSF